MHSNKTFRRAKTKSYKKYTPEQKFKYHAQRDTAPGRFNLKYGKAKHCYSFGFVDGFSGIDNSLGTRNEFGSRSAAAYEAGNKRGRKAAIEYLKRTGKQPFIFALENK